MRAGKSGQERWPTSRYLAICILEALKCEDAVSFHHIQAASRGIEALGLLVNLEFVVQLSKDALVPSLAELPQEPKRLMFPVSRQTSRHCQKQETSSAMILR